MKRETKIILMGLTLVSILFGLVILQFYYYTQHSFYLENNQNKPNSKILPAYNLTLIIDYGNGTIDYFYSLNLTSVPNTTAFHILLLVATVNYTWYGDDVFVEAINGVWNNENNSNRWWQYWVNDNLPMTAANHYYLSNNSVVAWRYWKPQM